MMVAKSTSPGTSSASAVEPPRCSTALGCRLENRRSLRLWAGSLPRESLEGINAWLAKA